MNLATADWAPNSALVMYSNILSCLVNTCNILVALAIIFYHIKAGQGVWGREEFKKICGALLDGSSVMEWSKDGLSQGHLLLPPIVFFIRRLVFIAVVVFLKVFVGQVLVQLLMTIL